MRCERLSRVRVALWQLRRDSARLARCEAGLPPLTANELRRYDVDAEKDVVALGDDKGTETPALDADGASSAAADLLGGARAGVRAALCADGADIVGHVVREAVASNLGRILVEVRRLAPRLLSRPGRA